MKSTIKLLAALLSVSLLGGCAAQSGGESSQGGSSTPTPSAPTVISAPTSEAPSTPEESAPALTATIRFARPFFKSTLDIADFNASAFADYEALGDFLREGSEGLSEPEFLEIKSGDVLKNGLTVTVEPSPIEVYTLIRLDGQLTMEGVLHLEQEDHDYIFRARDLMFYPNCTENGTIPTAGDEISVNVFRGMNGVACDGYPYFLGNIDNVDINEREIFGDSELARVKITVENITMGAENSVYDLSPRAEIVSVEPLP